MIAHAYLDDRDIGSFFGWYGSAASFFTNTQ